MFFFAPFLGIVMGLAQLVIHRRHEMPYGPFLCLSALGVIIGWPWLWDRTLSTFAVPWLVPGFVGVCLVAMFFTLLVWGFIKRPPFSAGDSARRRAGSVSDRAFYDRVSDQDSGR